LTEAADFFTDEAALLPSHRRSWRTLPQAGQQMLSPLCTQKLSCSARLHFSQVAKSINLLQEELTGFAAPSKQRIGYLR